MNIHGLHLLGLGQSRLLKRACCGCYLGHVRSPGLPLLRPQLRWRLAVRWGYARVVHSWTTSSWLCWLVDVLLKYTQLRQQLLVDIIVIGHLNREPHSQRIIRTLLFEVCLQFLVLLKVLGLFKSFIQRGLILLIEVFALVNRMNYFLSLLEEDVFFSTIFVQSWKIDSFLKSLCFEGRHSSWHWESIGFTVWFLFVLWFIYIPNFW